ncbi:MAG: gamma-glutamyl-gamma-aminobutyrate hydrolase family protein, partial [Lachnospiraceae bacterium]|nr:gamma-glutamyl-gamma-aminobutyrate hydrolase family protein [Lachnospiraceae bacterium]
MKILIADRSSQTKNYEAALLSLRADFEISLSLRSADSASRLLLPGGGDIHPSRYGQPDSGAQDIDEELDEVQFSLLDTFVRAGKPVLGICKGLQIINVYFGGDLLNLRTAPIHKSRGRDRQHAVYSPPGSLLYSLYGPC